MMDDQKKFCPHCQSKQRVFSLCRTCFRHPREGESWCPACLTKFDVHPVIFRCNKCRKQISSLPDRHSRSSSHQEYSSMERKHFGISDDALLDL